MVIPLRDDNPTTTKPVVTLFIIAACVFVFVLGQPRGNPDKELNFLVDHAAIPCEITHGQPMSNGLSARCDGQLRSAGVPASEEFFPHKHIYLAIVASMFLHGSWLHLLGNMLFLWIFGNNIEDRLGKVGYAVFYLLAGVASAAAHIATQPGSTTPVIGASGAIAGVMGAYLVLFPKARVLTIVPLFIFLQFVYLPAYIVLLLWFGMQFLTNPNTGVAVAAHIGGFVVGAGVALLLRGATGPPPPPEPDFGFGRPPY
jgi:membrane associated rhomboid family serine protease